MAKSDEYVNVRIGKMTYRLSSGGDLQRTYDIAATADAMMDQVTKRHPHLNQVSQAVLALVNSIGLMEDFHLKIKEAYQERDFARMQQEELKAELNRLREQFWELKKDVLYYQNLCDIYEKKLAERGIEEDSSVKQERRIRRVQPGDYQLTIEDAITGDEPKDNEGDD